MNEGEWFMKSKWRTRLFAGTLAAAMFASGAANVMAGDYTAASDGMMEVEKLASDMGVSASWETWQREWNSSVKTDWTQISLTPGSDEGQLNFAWYSKQGTTADTEDERQKEISLQMESIVKDASPELAGSTVLKLIIGEGRSMRRAKVYTAEQTEVAGEMDANGNTYYSNKVTATGLTAGKTYFYSYETENGIYTEPAEYKAKAADRFSFVFVGDPQIGSSNKLKGKDTEKFYNAQSEAVCSDAFNWEMTLKAAMDKSENQAAFVVSAGDQIQTTKRKAPNKNPASSEIEYAGYLSPEVLKSLPVATTVGSHDADNANYTYHFNTPNVSDLGSNGIAGGDYWFTYGSVLFLMLNTQNTNVAEHKSFIEQAVAANTDCKWRVVTLHQDIYGSAKHSNEPGIINLRYELTPYFEANDVDVVLTGHDHSYSRSKMLLGDTPSDPAKTYTDDEFDEQLDKAKSEAVINPEGILYMTANSSSGSKYYDLVPRMQTYIANRWQEDIPTYSIVEVSDATLSINTYRTDTNEKIDKTFTIAKLSVDKSGLQALVDEGNNNIVPAKNTYTVESYSVFKKAMRGAEVVLNDSKASSSEVEAAILALINAKASLVKKETTQQISDISAATVKKIGNKTYTGKAIKPSVTVSLNGTALKKETDYSVRYSDNKYTGKATVTITGKGNYTGTKKVTFNIVPKKVTLKSVKAGSKTAKVTFAKAAGKVTGYEIKYATDSKYKKAKTKSTAKTTEVLKSLKSGKTYYVKVRAYKKVSGGKVYGAYSKTVKVKVK